MVANGHSWSSIRHYSLSELGVFFKTIVLSEREETAETLSNLWMGSNLEHKGLIQVLDSLRKAPSNEQKETVDEINNNWKRLASFMARQN